MGKGISEELKTISSSTKLFCTPAVNINGICTWPGLTTEKRMTCYLTRGYCTYGVANNTHTFVKNIMTKWQTEMFFNKTALGNVKINRGIYQGDCLSPLLFVIVLVPLTKSLIVLKVVTKSPKLRRKSIIFSTWMILSCTLTYRSN